jgi:tRNA(Ile2) C34 agmatinyltransferase TiaS
MEGSNYLPPGYELRQKEKAAREELKRQNLYKKPIKYCKMCRIKMLVNGITGGFTCPLCKAEYNNKGILVREGTAVIDKILKELKLEDFVVDIID